MVGLFPGEIRATIQYKISTDEQELYVRCNDGEGYKYLIFKWEKADGFKIKPVIESEFTDSFPSTMKVLQTILDECWKYGMRPTGYKEIDETGIKYHLEDMRRLVFK